MNFTNLTDTQVRVLQAAIIPLHDVVKEEAFLKAMDLVIGMANTAGTAAVDTLATGINTYTTTLTTKLNADAGVTDTNYAASNL